MLLTLPLPVTTALLVYWPATALPPLALYCHVSVASSRPLVLPSPTLKLPDRTGAGWKSSARLPGVPLSSVTNTFLIGSLLPVAVTLYVQVIGVPAATTRPGALSLLVPLV